MESLKAGLSRLFHADGALCLPLSGPATSAMEAAMLNLLEPGDVAVVGVNGVFGGRMADMAERAGAEVVRIEETWGRPIDPQKAEAALWARGAKVFAFVHAETSTGAMSDARTLCGLAKEHGAFSVVDCVTSLGGTPVDMASWGADVVYSGSQKCLSAPPGLAPFAISRPALASVAERRSKPRTWLGDLSLLMSYWGDGKGGRAYHHTAPVNALYGLHEALVAYFEEGEERVFARHRRTHEQLAAGLAALELDFHTPRACRLPQLNAVLVPEGVDEARVRAHLLNRYGVEIGAGLGPLRSKIWRIGLMGASATERNVMFLLSALADALSAQGRPASARDALAAAARPS